MIFTSLLSSTSSLPNQIRPFNGLLKIHPNPKISISKPQIGCSRLITRCFNESGLVKPSSSAVEIKEGSGGNPNFSSKERLNVGIENPNFMRFGGGAKLSLGDQAFFLLAFIACTTSIAFTSLVIAAVPTLYAMGRAATSLSKLADTVREELPSTMAAIRLSGMEISDLTLELSDLSQEITNGVNKSAQAVQAAEAGIRQIGTIARQQTMSMINERASLPIISIQPVVAGAAKKTSSAVGRAKKSFMNIISRGESSSEIEEN